MRLKKIRLAGFKSFVDPTNIPFPDDMTAIVGPNGCGKSNVIDAVRWVLGESSAKNLRGDAMTDVIFNGSSARKPVSQCSVELVFDNSSGRLDGEYARYNELSVKRVVTRDATSTYFLNGSKCRRRDVTDLFLGTGLGPRSYAIIEQGMISRLIESKPQELRIFIEEAAGVSKYKERRRETENRIRHTRENLERLEDVRLELGVQLEKLQRQASAARRYKELKAKERKYKAELAGIRWSKHNKIIVDMESRIEQQETDIQQLIAQQRGDETSIHRHKETQADLKQTLADIQQIIFNLATDITRIEQTQIHAKQRAQQVEKELRQKEDEQRRISIKIDGSNTALSDLRQSTEAFGPQIDMLQAQCEAANDALLLKEETLIEKQSLWREQEQAHTKLKQQIQSTHSQIQSALQMQLRTEQRITEIKQEIQNIDGSDIHVELNELEATLLTLEQRYNEVQSGAEHTNEQYELAKQAHDFHKAEQQRCYQQWQTQQARWQSLKEVHQQQQKGSDVVEAWHAEQAKSALPLWETLSVEAGWEKAMETALQQWQGAFVTNFIPSSTVDGVKLLKGTEFTSNKQANTLATKCLNEEVPAWLNDILLSSNEKEAKDKANALAPHQSVITKTGFWLSHAWLIQGTGTAEESVLVRANELKILEEQAETLSCEHEIMLEKWQGLEADLERTQAAKQQAQHQLNQLALQRDQSQKQAVFLQQQVQRQAQQSEKLKSDLLVQQEQIELEQAQLETLNGTIIDLEEQQTQRGEEGIDYEGLRETLRSEVEQMRQTAQQHQQQKHQLELQQQAQQNQLNAELQNLARLQEQCIEVKTRVAGLKEEQEELHLPLEAQAEKLERLLTERNEQQLRQSQANDALSEVEEKLLTFEKGRDGFQARIEKAKETQQSTRVECEGHKVRANAVIEQLQEMQQPLKTILDTLPDSANEQTWQAELDKTVASLSRLGAVNLAAVEEYDVQAERKQHLDDQNNDLVAALDTLESAIRKIDKETRNRFKETFEQVNNDLKQLFPKVFGGGSAYLDLTDDDLLETGVTIMARPPGKKNSTIHLLSGGEKALTALSLVFAIFRLNPAPFCLLDEVDAPLDDANVGRFCKLVSEMSKSVQFIYITHNKIAMEMALHLTGVTMGEPGVSRVVAVDVEEAVAIVNA